MPDIPYNQEGGSSSPVPEASTGALPSTSRFASFIGRGVVTPFRRAAGDLSTADGIAKIKSNIRRILGVRGGNEYANGELPWRTEFGSLLYRLRHRQNSAVAQEMARIYVVEALSRWERRVLVRRVEITKERGNDGNLIERPVLLIRIFFDIRAVENQNQFISRGEELSFLS